MRSSHYSSSSSLLGTTGLRQPSGRSVQVEVWDFPGSQPLARLSHSSKVAAAQAPSPGPVGALAWLSQGAGPPVLLIGDATNCTLRLWSLGSTGLSGTGSLRIEAAPGSKVCLQRCLPVEAAQGCRLGSACNGSVL